MNNRVGHRGYIGSRVYANGQAPQHVQNLVVRDFCQRNKFQYLLSATEYAMAGCYVMLEEVARESAAIEGIVLYSIHMLPRRRARRLAFCRRILSSGATLHGAVENIHICGEDDLAKLDDLFGIMEIVAANAPELAMLRGLA